MRSFFRQASLAVPLLLILGYSNAARADCTFGTPSGGEPSLQISLGQFLLPPPNAVTGCLDDGVGASGDAYWETVGQTSATMLLEIAGFANVNSFGIFDASDPTNRLMVFGGPAGPGARAMITFMPTGDVSITIGGVTRSAHFGSTAFGFYLLSGEGHTMHSDSSLNPGEVDRMYAYRGNGGRFISGPVVTDGNPRNDIFGPNDVILAYEDLLNGDNDFQDFVVLVRGVQPVPLPAAAWLFGGALLLLRSTARRRKTPL